MKRWHLTLLLALLAAGGVSLAVGLRPGRSSAPAATAIGAAAPAGSPPGAPISASIEIRPSPGPEEATATAQDHPHPHPHPHPDAHPIHVDPGEPGGTIPELSEPRSPPRAPVLRELPVDPPGPLRDGCPTCGMG